MVVVDCRSLIEFCRSFEHHRLVADGRGACSEQNHSCSGKKNSKSLNPLSHPFCEHSTYAAIDAVLLLLVLTAISVLTIPYLKAIFSEAYEVFPEAICLLGQILYHVPVAYVVGFVVMLVFAVIAWEFLGHQSRKCGNPYCKGLKKAVEFDIQLESEDCVRYLPPLPKNAFGTQHVELGQDHKELEAELKKMAPLNGRTVLIFRAPCGCPEGRMEVWGAKKVRRIKK